MEMNVPEIPVRGRYKSTSTGEVVKHGSISQDCAEIIFRRAMSAWSLGDTGSDEVMRDQLLTGLVEASLQGTSSETDFTKVSFTLDGVSYTLEPLREIATGLVNYPNPVRVWFKCFRKAQMAIRAMDFLDNEKNVTQRQEAMMKYNSGHEVVRFCFDYSSALVSSGLTFTATERRIIYDLGTYMNARANLRAIEAGSDRAPADNGGIVGGSAMVLNNSSRPSQTGSADTRAKFPSLM